MPSMRFNHMELTFGRGELNEAMRADIDGFFGGVLGWQTQETPLFGQTGHLLQPDPDQFILLMEVDHPIQSPSYDHLGLLVDTPEQVDDLHEQCRRFQEKDDRLRLKEFDDLVSPNVVCHAFYVRYLLPIWFDVQSLTYGPDRRAGGRWQYVTDDAPAGAPR